MNSTTTLIVRLTTDINRHRYLPLQQACQDFPKVNFLPAPFPMYLPGP